VGKLWILLREGVENLRSPGFRDQVCLEEKKSPPYP